MRGTGMRNARELYFMRVENVDFDSGTIFTPDSKLSVMWVFSINWQGAQTK